MDKPHLEPALRRQASPVAESRNADPAAVLLVDTRDGRGRRLLATAEPVDPTPSGEAVALRALAALRRSFLSADQEPLVDALKHAFDVANREVHTENDRTIAADHRRVFIGATAVATDGAELLVALSPPGQAIVSQDGQFFAFPDLASWRPGFEPDSDLPAAEPLGLSASVEPEIYATVVAPGDSVLIGSTAIGRCLAAAPQLAELASNPSWLPAALKRVGAAGHNLGCAAWMTVSPDPAPVAPIVPKAQTAFAGDLPVPADDWLSPGLRRAIFCDRIHTWLIETFERLVPASAPPVMPLAGPSRAVGPLGAGYVRRYRGAWRGDGSPFSSSHSPRGPRLPFRGRAIAAFLLVLLMLGGLYAGYDYRQARAHQVDSFLSVADAYLAAVTSTQPPDAIDTQLDEAEAALEAAAGNGASISLLRSRREAIATIRDRAHNVTRLTRVTRLGTLPAGVARTTPQLLGDGQRLYLIADAVYQVDAETGAQTPLLVPGSTVVGRTVGPDLSAALDGDALVVSDGHSLFHLAPDGNWDASVLGSMRKRTDPDVTASAAFLGSFYVFDGASGEILKYPAEQLGSPPEVWLQKGSRPETLDARDLVVDGSIYVLGNDGEIASYYRGEAREAFRLGVEPPVAEPVSLVGGPETEFLYLVDKNGTDGRILRFDRHGKDVRQFLLPLAWQEELAPGAADEFAHVSDVAIDETTDTIYFVGRTGIWQAKIPADAPNG
ncbi:MAG: hypothetical protein QOF33_3058 [Thermomicrobiales bacterium]|nr:hypothetical protein [Thermomicrobiales bacterium]